MGGSTARDLLLFHAAVAAGAAPAAKRSAPVPAPPAPSRYPRPVPAPPPAPALEPLVPVPAVAAAPVAPSARGGPADALGHQVAAWAEERCTRTTEFSASLDTLLADFRQWRGGAAVGRAEFEAGLGALPGVRVWSGSVVVGLVLR